MNDMKSRDGIDIVSNMKEMSNMNNVHSNKNDDKRC